MVCIALFKNRRCLTSRHIDSFAGDIERHIAVHTHTRKCSHDFSGVHVKNHELRRFARGGKQPVIGFVQGYRMSYMRVWQGPSGNELTSVQINDPNLIGAREVHVKLFALTVNDHALVGISRKPGNLTDLFKRPGINDSEHMRLPESNRLIVADGGDTDAVELVDCKEYKIISTLKLGPGVDNSAYNPLNKYFY